MEKRELERCWQEEQITNEVGALDFQLCVIPAKVLRRSHVTILGQLMLTRMSSKTKMQKWRQSPMLEQKQASSAIEIRMTPFAFDPKRNFVQMERNTLREKAGFWG